MVKNNIFVDWGIICWKPAHFNEITQKKPNNALRSRLEWKVGDPTNLASLAIYQFSLIFRSVVNILFLHNWDGGKYNLVFGWISKGLTFGFRCRRFRTIPNHSKFQEIFAQELVLELIYCCQLQLFNQLILPLRCVYNFDQIGLIIAL